MVNEIIKTVKSVDGGFCYTVYKQKAQQEDIISNTYGICAFEVANECSINDVLTDLDEAIRLAEAAAEKSIPTSALGDFVMNYLSDM